MKKQIVMMVKVYLMTVLLAFVLIVAVFALPTDKMQSNMVESAQILLDEGIYPTFLDEVLIRMHPDNAHDLKTLLLNNRITARDNYTDALMLAQASYDGDEPVTEQAMAVYRWSTEEENPFGLLSVITGQDNFILQREQYDRYWHGYLVVLKPLLLFFNLSQIRIINVIVLIALLGYCIYLMKRKVSQTAVGWFMYALLFFMPFTIPLCMQYCTATYVLLVTLIVLFRNYDRLQKDYFINLYFMVVGMIVVYVDYLTFPLITFGIPVIFVMLMDKGQYTFKADLWRVFRYGIDWSVGYAGLWAAKWIVASVVLHKNVVLEGIQQVVFRSSSMSEMGDFKVTLWKAIGSNVCNYVNVFYVIIIIIGIVIACRNIRLQGCNFMDVIQKNGIYLLIALIPFVWYGLLKNHSYSHGSFTFRCLVITVYAGMIFLQKWSENTESSRKLNE